MTPVDVGDKKEYLIPRGKHINVYEGDYVRAGEPLIGGAANPQDILKIKGEVALANTWWTRSRRCTGSRAFASTTSTSR
jgi:hypothetical protein